MFLRGGLTPQCTLCLKRGTLGQFVDLRGEGGLERKRGMVFLRGVRGGLISQCTLWKTVQRLYN